MVYYITPAGDKLRTKNEIQLHLTEGLTIDMYTFTAQSLNNENEIVRTASERGYKPPQQHNRTICDNDFAKNEIVYKDLFSCKSFKNE